MIRALPAGVLALIILGVVLALSMLVVKSGLTSDDGVTLWAGAITAGGGQMPLGRILAAYPTIPFLASALLEASTPAGTPTPSLLSAGLVAVLGASWLMAFRRAGLPLLVAVAAIFLLAFHPAMLRAAIAGPSDMFLAVFLCLLASSLFDLRARSGAAEVMAVALALLGLCFAHPMGAALACAAVPLLVFAVQPELVASAAFNVVVALIFPTVFCVAAFSYMSWVFPGSGWTFLVAPAEGLATWSVGVSQMFGSGVSGSLAFDAGLAMFVAFALGAPLTLVALIWVRRRRPLAVPVVVIVAMTVFAALIAVATGVFGDPAAIAVAPPILAAVVMARINAIKEHAAVALVLLAVGWFGGLAGVTLVDPRSTEGVRAALEGRDMDPERAAAIDLGRSIAGRDGVLVDTFNTPAVVLGRGKARGLLSPSDEAFTLSLLFSELDSPYVAVPDPHIGDGAQDRLNKSFPFLYRLGAPGYRLIYNNERWRLYARE